MFHGHKALGKQESQALGSSSLSSPSTSSTYFATGVGKYSVHVSYWLMFSACGNFQPGKIASVKLNMDLLLGALLEMFVNSRLTTGRRRTVLVLGKCLPDVSKDPTNLSHIPGSCEKMTLSDGVYSHIELVGGLLLSFGIMAVIMKSIDLQLDVNSLSLLRSSSKQL